MCHLVGDGPLRRQVAAQIRRTGLPKQMRMHGRLPRHEVVKMHGSADVLVLASVPTRRGKREGIPVVLMEGMASGLPVVSSAISGIPELVVSEQTGLLVPPRDATALADALYRLWNDAALRDRLGQGGREKVLQEFNLPTNAAELSQLFLQESPVMQADS